MNTFYIDRSLGSAVFIEVENGTVTRVFGESEKYNNRMMELYGGKPISFLKTDFEARMKPSFHCVHSMDNVDAIQKLEAAKSRVRQAEIWLTDRSYKGDTKAIKERLDKELYPAQYEAEKNLATIREEMLQVHGWNFPN